MNTLTLRPQENRNGNPPLATFKDYDSLNQIFSNEIWGDRWNYYSATYAMGILLKVVETELVKHDFYFQQSKGVDCSEKSENLTKKVRVLGSCRKMFSAT
jgi:hypothetical protein